MNKILLACFCLISLNGISQNSKHKWSGYNFGPQLGVIAGKFHFDKYTPQFNQISGLYVAGRGIVIVPGTTREVAEKTAKKTSPSMGLHFGYMRQFKSIVIGLETEINYLPSFKGSQDVDDSLPPTVLQWRSAYGIHHTAGINFTGSLKAKLGYAFNSSLIYFTLGAAFSNLKISTADYYNSTTYWAKPWIDNMSHPTPSDYRFVGTNNNNTSYYPFHLLSFGLGYSYALSENLIISLDWSNAKYAKELSINQSDTTINDPNPPYPAYGIIAANSQKIKVSTNQVNIRLDMKLVMFRNKLITPSF